MLTAFCGALKMIFFLGWVAAPLLRSKRLSVSDTPPDRKPRRAGNSPSDDAELRTDIPLCSSYR